MNPIPNLPPIEKVAAKVHEAWMEERRKQGFTSVPSVITGEEQMRPYAELSEAVKDYDRATVRAVYAAIYDAL